MTSTLGELVRAARRDAGFTQEVLAERSLLSVRTLGDIEAGRQLRPRRETLEDLLRALAPPAAEAQAIRAAWRETQTVADAPVMLDPFIGRSREVVAVRELVRTNRLVTLCGLAGVGKTRLALAAIGGLAKAFERVLFIGLAGTDRDEDVASVVLARIGGRPTRDDALASLSATLRGSRSLLVVDSAEHVRGGVTALVDALLASAGPALLVTSQIPLSIRHERLMIVEPLPAPEALQLLVDRAQRAGAVNLTAREPLTAICERLDRLPLAIELAAPKLRTLTASTLLERLGGDLTLLTADPRQHRYPTLRAALEWNYAQLGGDEQRALRALSTFAGSWPLVAAEDLCGAGVLALLDRLVAANFITRAEAADGSDRYWVQGVIRDYARGLVGDDERDTLARLHVACAARLVRGAAAPVDGPALPSAQFDTRLASVVDACIEDVFVAAEAAGRLGLRGAGIEIVAGLYRYWPSRGRAGWAAELLGSLLADAERHGDVAPPILAAGYRAARFLSGTATGLDEPAQSFARRSSKAGR